jgi:prepilin-type N-terminal cleavage/methylation domain-containing protein
MSGSAFHADERGLTLIELMLGALVLSVVALATNGIALATLKTVDVGSMELQQAASFGRALQTLSEDLRQPAASGIAIGGATYNTANTITLGWTDRTTTPATQYSIGYAVSGTDLVRTRTVTQGASSTTTSFVVARNLDPAGASGGARFSRTAAAPGVVRTLLTILVGATSTTYDFTVEQRP